MRSKTKYIILGAILFAGIFLRTEFMLHQVGNINAPDFGGDPCHHYSIAKNIALGNGPKTDFIFSYWFHHKEIPAVTDIYPPGTHYVMAGFMKLLSVDFLSARLASLVLGSLSILLIYAIAQSFIGSVGGLIAASFLALNTTHIEHSAVVMTPVIATFFILIAFQIMLFAIKEKSSVWWAGALGLLVGLTHLMQSIAPVFVITYLIISFDCADHKKDLIKKWSLFFMGLIISLIPWGIYTLEYFGKPLYSNLSFYPLVNSWQLMNYEIGLPVFDSSPGLLKLATIAFIQFFKKITVFQLSLPGLDAPFYMGLALSLFVFGLLFNFKNKKIFPVYLFMLLSFAGLTVGSRALNWHIWPRHYITTIPFAIIITSSGVLWLLRKFNPSEKMYKIILTITIITALSRIFITDISFRTNPTTFWSFDSDDFKTAAIWIKNNTKKSDRFMFASTPQDLACYTDRQVVIDPSEAGGPRHRTRAAEEIAFYNVKYLMISNTTADIYGRAQIDLNHMEEYYPGVLLTEVYTNEKRTVTIYSVH